MTTRQTAHLLVGRVGVTTGWVRSTVSGSPTATNYTAAANPTTQAPPAHRRSRWLDRARESLPFAVDAALA
jgi:hypothetical protein